MSDDVCKILKVRERESHKGTYGSAMLFAGSDGMMGAALLSARACMRSGLGLLTVHTASCGYTVLQLGIPEAKCERDSSETHITRIEIPGNKVSYCSALASSASSKIQAVGIGPGIGKHPETAEALHRFLISLSVKGNISLSAKENISLSGKGNEELSKLPRLILDADALNILSDNPEWLRLLPERTIITPHPGEWKRIESAINSLSDRTILPHLIIVFKGAFTRVADINLGDGKVFAEWTNTEHGHSGMAVGGSGDTLTGIILSLLAQGYEPYDAARLGVYVHSLAADLALINTDSVSPENRGEQSEESWLPSDLIENLGRAFTQIANQ